MFGDTSYVFFGVALIMRVTLFHYGEIFMSVKFGEHLRFLRTSRTDMSQTDVAKQLNIDRSTYTNYELGNTEPPMETLKKIAGIFGISIDRLVFWEHNKFI